MIKNKLKYIIFIPLFVLFFAFFSVEIKASDYPVTINNVTNLVYGNKLKDAIIDGESSEVEGEFSFYNKEIVLDRVGEIELEIIFVPKDSNEVKKISYNAIVEKREISIFFFSPIYKQYDGSDNIKLPAYTYQGIINEEVSIQGGLRGKLTATYVSEDIPIILSGIEIVGDKKDCYYLDLLEHSARVYPSTLNKSGVNETQIIIDEGVYVDIGYSLKVEEQNKQEKINDKYTGFKVYKYDVYSYNNVLLEINSEYQVKMVIDEDIKNKERLALFEVTKDGEYKKLNYNIKDSEIHFTIDSNSKVVFATRNIEYHFILLCTSILIFYAVFIVVYRCKNSKILNGSKY